MKRSGEDHLTNEINALWEEGSEGLLVRDREVCCKGWFLPIALLGCAGCRRHCRCGDWERRAVRGFGYYL